MTPTEQATITRDIIDGYIAFIPLTSPSVLFRVLDTARNYLSQGANNYINPADIYRTMTIDEFDDLVRHIMSTYLERIRKNIGRRKIDNKRELYDIITSTRDAYFDFLGVELYKSSIQVDVTENDQDISPENFLRLYAIYEKIYRPYMRN